MCVYVDICVYKMCVYTNLYTGGHYQCAAACGGQSEQTVCIYICVYRYIYMKCASIYYV